MATISTINVSVANDNNGDTLRNAFVKVNDNFAELNSKKVEAELGKGLSENDLTDSLKNTYDTHLTDETKHLTTAQNTLLDAITVTAQKINYLANVTSDVQTQINNLASSELNGTWVEYSLRHETNINRFPFFSQSAINGGDWNGLSHASNGDTWLNGLGFNSSASANSGYKCITTQSATFSTSNKKYFYVNFSLPNDNATRIVRFGRNNNDLPINGIWGYWFEISNKTISLKAGDNTGIVNTSSSVVLDHLPGSTNVTIHYHALLWRDSGNIYGKVVRNDGVVVLDVNFPSATANLPTINDNIQTSLQAINTGTSSLHLVTFAKFGYGTKLPLSISSVFGI